MPWTSPTLTTLRDRFRTDFKGRTTTGDAVLRRSVENVYSYAVPALAHGLYGFIGWAVRQLIPSETSDLDSLLKWSNDFLDEPQLPATAAIGNVTFTGTDTTVIPIGTEIASRDGIAYTTDAQYTISGTEITGAVTASEAGAAGNLAEDANVLLSTPIAGIDSTATVATGGLSGGADEETSVGVLGRLRDRFRAAPRGGSAGDYEAWAKEVAGISRAYEFRQDPTTGWVRVVVIDDTSGPIPGGTLVDDAQDNVDLKRPQMMGGAIVQAPTAHQLTMTWTNLVPLPGQSVAAAKIALEASVENWVLTTHAPGTGIAQAELENQAQAVVTSITLSLTSPTGDPVATGADYGIFTTFVHNYS